MVETQAKKPRFTNKHHMRAKLIFNPGSGAVGESPVQLMDVISEMQAWKLVPEAYLVEPDGDLPGVIQNALEEGIRMFVVCGGDGTIDVLAGALAGTNATLGIIPTGTQNNVALSLGIPPADIPAAIAILRTGQRIKVDMGLAEVGEIKRSFLEVCSVGLLSALFPSADDIQHGNLTRVGDFLATLVASSPAEMHLTLEGKQEITTMCHAVLVSNMPYIGPHFQVGTPASINDGLLDVLLFADLSKMDLLGYAVQAARPGGGPEDERIQHYHVRRVDIDTNPAMPVMVDGLALGDGPLRISVQRHALAVMVGEPAPGSASKSVKKELYNDRQNYKNKEEKTTLQRAAHPRATAEARSRQGWSGSQVAYLNLAHTFKVVRAPTWFPNPATRSDFHSTKRWSRYC